MNKTFRKIWKGFWEPVLHCPIIQWVVAVLMAVSIWFVYLTCRRKISGYENFKQYKKKPVIFVFWHGRSMMLSPVIALVGKRGFAVTSRHSDGRMMAKLQRLFGLRPIYGSTSDGGISVLRQGVRELRAENTCLCISPDGPGGPSMRVQDGALYFAKMTGAPIIPVCFSASKSWFQNRWDRYLVALPFSKLSCNIGTPIFVSARATKEEFEHARKTLEDYMVRQVREMDAEYGLMMVEQDQTASQFKKSLREGREQKKAQKKMQKKSGTNKKKTKGTK